MAEFVTDLLGQRVEAKKIDGSSWTLSTAYVCSNDVIGIVRLITPDFVMLVEDRDGVLQVVMLGSHRVQVLPS